jgi:hypothetical protein
MGEMSNNEIRSKKKPLDKPREELSKMSIKKLLANSMN